MPFLSIGIALKLSVPLAFSVRQIVMGKMKKAAERSCSHSLWGYLVLNGGVIVSITNWNLSSDML